MKSTAVVFVLSFSCTTILRLPSKAAEMSTPLPASTFETSPVPRPTVRLPDWLREPFLHFVILGGVLFAVDHWVASPKEDPNAIVVGAEVDKEAVDVFEQSRGRKPTAEELKVLHRVWLDNEILYREGLAMGLDKGDSAIRERVIFKALSVVDANVRLPNVDDKQLREWFESRRAKYDDPARYDFQEAALSGDSSESAVRAFVDALNAGTPGDAQAGLRVFKSRPQSNIVQSYGEDFAKALEQATPGQWHAMRTREGWRAIQLNKITPPRPADYDVLRGVVFQDWKDSIASEQRSAAVRALEGKYKIRFETGAGSGASANTPSAAAANKAGSER
jgi:hypothetical protein